MSDDEVPDNPPDGLPIGWSIPAESLPPFRQVFPKPPVPDAPVQEPDSGIRTYSEAGLRGLHCSTHRVPNPPPAAP